MIKTIKAVSIAELESKIEAMKETHKIEIVSKHGETVVVNENTGKKEFTDLGKKGFFKHGWNVCVVLEVEKKAEEVQAVDYTKANKKVLKKYLKANELEATEELEEMRKVVLNHLATQEA